MDPIILDNIPFEIDEDATLEQLHVRLQRPEAAIARRLIAEARALGRPRAMYKIVYLEEHADDHVVIDGITFKSRVLSVNLAKVHRVFAFAATGGVELEIWQTRPADMLENYWADAITELGVRAAMMALDRHLREVYDLKPLSGMHPGSLGDWPITEQGPLFRLLGDVEAAIGVCLTPSYLMVPRKSVSGLQFPAEETFASCLLCPRVGCPNRRAPYDADLWARKYEQTA